MDQLATLRAARKALKDAPDSGRYERRLTGKTIKQFWESQDDAGKRDYLLNELHWKVYAEKDDSGQVVVTFEGGESLLSDIAQAVGLTADQVQAIDWVPVLANARERGLPMDPDELVKLASDPDEIKRLARETAARNAP